VDRVESEYGDEDAANHADAADDDTAAVGGTTTTTKDRNVDANANGDSDDNGDNDNGDNGDGDSNDDAKDDDNDDRLFYGNIKSSKSVRKNLRTTQRFSALNWVKVPSTISSSSLSLP